VSFLEELDDLGYDELVVRFDGPPLDDLVENSPHVFYQEVAMLLRERDPHAGAAFLRGRAGSDQPPARLVGALFGLSWQGAADIEHRPRALGTARRRLGDDQALEVRAAVDDDRGARGGAVDQLASVCACASTPAMQGVTEAGEAPLGDRAVDGKLAVALDLTDAGV